MSNFDDSLFLIGFFSGFVLVLLCILAFYLLNTLFDVINERMQKKKLQQQNFVEINNTVIADE